MNSRLICKKFFILDYFPPTLTIRSSLDTNFNSPCSASEYDWTDRYTQEFFFYETSNILYEESFSAKALSLCWKLFQPLEMIEFKVQQRCKL